MFTGEAFVTEDTTDFEDAVEAGDEHTFEIKFEGDTEEEVMIKGIHMGYEGFSGGATGDVVEHRSFDFGVFSIPKKLANFLNNLGPFKGTISGFGVNDEIQVSLAVNLVIIGEAVPFFGEGSEGFGDEGNGLGADGNFFGFSFKEGASNANDIADIEFFKIGVGRWADIILGDIDLDFAIAVEEFNKSCLTHIAVNDDTSGNGE
jgi:hypothetical protein